MASINTLQIGETAKIIKLGKGDNPQYRRKLLQMGLTNGAEITLVRKAPLGDPITIAVRGFELILRKQEAAILEVEKTAPCAN